MQKTFVINNPSGIHARPAKKIVQAASSYACTVQLEKAGKPFSAKSLVGVLSLGGKFGDTITVIAEGEQEEAAIQEIGSILTSVEAEQG